MRYVQWWFILALAAVLVLPSHTYAQSSTPTTFVMVTPTDIPLTPTPFLSSADVSAAYARQSYDVQLFGTFFVVLSLGLLLLRGSR